MTTIWIQCNNSLPSILFPVEVKDLLNNVSGLGRARDKDISERKVLRARKLAEFRDQTEKILGSSFDGDRWRRDNKDDEKKEITKMFERKLSKELNLPIEFWIDWVCLPNLSWQKWQKFRGKASLRDFMLNWKFEPVNWITLRFANL